jgi:hypothetical protein
MGAHANRKLADAYGFAVIRETFVSDFHGIVRPADASPLPCDQTIEFCPGQQGIGHQAKIRKTIWVRRLQRRLGKQRRRRLDALRLERLKVSLSGRRFRKGRPGPPSSLASSIHGRHE